MKICILQIPGSFLTPVSGRQNPLLRCAVFISISFSELLHEVITLCVGILGRKIIEILPLDSVSKQWLHMSGLFACMDRLITLWAMKLILKELLN